MPDAGAASPPAAPRRIPTSWPWLAYAVCWLLFRHGFPIVGACVFAIGMIPHWKYWLSFIGGFAIGYAWAGPNTQRRC